MAFGKDIKRLRELEKLSANKLAGLIGVDANRMRKWEEKDFNPRDEDARIIEGYFGMPLSEIGKLKSIREFVNVPHGTFKKKVDLPSEIGSIEEKILRIEASLEVYESAIAGILSREKNDFIQKVSELREAVSKVTNRRLDELKR